MALAAIEPKASLTLVSPTQGVTVTENPDNPAARFEVVVTDATGKHVTVALTQEEARAVGMTLLGTPEWA